MSAQEDSKKPQSQKPQSKKEEESSSLLDYLVHDHVKVTGEDGAGVSFDNGEASLLLQISDGLHQSLDQLNSSRESTVWIQKKLVRRLIEFIDMDNKEYFKITSTKFLRATDPVGNCDC